MKRMKRGFFLSMLVAAAVGIGAPALADPPENWTSGIAYDVPPSAKITKVGFSIEKTEAGPMLTYEVGIQNISDKAVRFKLTIYPLEGDPVAGYYPLVERKGKPMALEPKEIMVQKWPVLSKEMPKGFALVIKDVEE